MRDLLHSVTVGRISLSKISASKIESSCNSIKTFDFSTLYTSIPHSKLEDKLKELVFLCFIKENCERIYKYLVFGSDTSYFVKKKQNILWKWHYQDAWFLGNYVERIYLIVLEIKDTTDTVKPASYLTYI